MGKKKRSKKFNISNRLAYTLIIVLSIVLLGIGVYAYGTNNPSVMGHSAGELNLDWGSVTTCEGTPTSCSTYTATDCPTSIGCRSGCAPKFDPPYSFIDPVCSSYGYSQSACEDRGCTWNPMSGDCFGTGYPYTCERIHTLSDCNADYFCTWGCSGEPYECSHYSIQSTCSSASGCSWKTRQRSITAVARGINIPYLLTGALCDLTGESCVSVRGVESAVSATVTKGSDYNRRISVPSSVTCPDGFYLSAVRTIGGSGSEAYLAGTCKPLPIR